MKNMLNVFAAAVLFVTFSCIYAYAEEPVVEEQPATEKTSSKPKNIQGIEVLTGYSHGTLAHDGSHKVIPLIVDINFNFKNITKKIGINPPSMIVFQLEPFFNNAFEPGWNMELGTAFAFKAGLVPETWKLQPYVKLGAGMLYENLHTPHQATGFNFIEFGGCGMHYFIKKNIALTIEGRIRHMSNASIRDPNHGINSYSGMAGILYNF
ncbi:MAG: acyloxyacyl hydrolase [Candidatus Omnitrophota bacterium]